MASASLAHHGNDLKQTGDEVNATSLAHHRDNLRQAGDEVDVDRAQAVWRNEVQRHIHARVLLPRQRALPQP